MSDARDPVRPLDSDETLEPAPPQERTDRSTSAPGGTTTAPSSTASAPVVPRTRAGAIWVASAATVILLILLLIFIAQNGQEVEVRYLGWEGQSSLAVVTLAAAVAGAGFVVLAGTARIIQLRLVARRNRDMDPPRKR